MDSRGTGLACNPTEQLWDDLERGLRATPSRPTSVRDLTKALLEERPPKTPHKHTPKPRGQPSQKSRSCSRCKGWSDVLLNATDQERIRNGTLFKIICESRQGDNSMKVNTVPVTTPDIMTTNGVVHIINSLLYPEDVPVGNQELLALLKRIIRHIQIKYVSGYKFQEIPLTFVIKTTEPKVTKVTRVIEGKPSVIKVTRVIEGPQTSVVDLESEMEKLTHSIQGGKLTGKRVQAGSRRKTRMTSQAETH